MPLNIESSQDTFFLKNMNGISLKLDEPTVMGILNITPDSFFDGGSYKNEEEILQKVAQLITEGSTIIDVGGYSSRPNAEHISEEEELARVLPIILLIRENYATIAISIDTFRSEVARQCVTAGANIINDISGGTLDPKMFSTVAELQVPYILMHIKGNPQTMQETPTYQNVVEEVKTYFKEKIDALYRLGFKNIIIDLGYGFGKTTEHNYQLLSAQHEFKKFGLPILTGVSRKSMITKILDCSPTEALNGTTALNTIALLNGANILRVHDVKEAKETIKLVEQIKQHKK